MRAKKWVFGVVLALGVVFTLGKAVLDRATEYSKFDKRHYLTSQQIAFVRPGLNLEVQDIQVGMDGSVAVTFTVADDRGLPLDLDGVFTPGPIRARFLLGTIPEGQNHYLTYTTREATSPITNDTAVQPTSDRGGSFEKVADGTYVYRFGTRLPEGYDANATHSVGIYSDRDLEEFGLGDQIDNDVVNFVPAGGMVERFRDVVRTDTCNQCHDPLAIHGGFRRDVELCVMCHYEGVLDPDTGNTVDFRVMIHKIHQGEDLPSVQAGTPYQIIGFRQSVHDYSHVAFPQDTRYCDTCHRDDAVQAEAYLLRPARDACGSCHDDVNFMSGEGHAGGPAISDRFCSNCHFPEGELEFDASIMGAHTIPANSRQLEGINIEIMDVTGTGPGENPTVFFTLTTNEGDPIEPSSLAFFNLVLAGPTTDYSFRVSEPAVEASVPLGEGYTYTFDAAIPADVEGTFAVGAEAFRSVVISGMTTLEMTVRETAENPVYYFGVTDGDPIQRRTIVSDARCENCHRDLAFHGTIRHDPEYCVMCHRPAADDSARRPEEEGLPESIDFKYLIHRIHSGEELTRDFTVYGFGNRPHNYNELLYPGDRRNCEACHEGETYVVPSQGVLPTVAPREFFSPIAPNSAACLACHDSLDAAAHAFLNIAPFGEACGACHGSEAEFAVERVHAR